MTDQPPEADSSPIEETDLFRQVVARLVLSDEHPHQVETMTRDFAALRPTDPKRRVLVVRYPGGAPAAKPASTVFAWLKKVLGASPNAVDIVLVGGDDTAQAALTNARGRLTERRQSLSQVRSDGSVWCEKGGQLSQLLIAAATVPALTDDEKDALDARIERDSNELSHELRQARDFGALLETGPVVATKTILGAVALMYLIELTFGGPNSSAVLLRLGALSPERVLDGELYRLLSVAGLHGSISHVFFNGMVIWNLGSFLERIAGTARFLLIFVSSIIAGSIASMTLVKPELSVGASGGLWGILAALGVLAWLGRGVLPEAAVPRARKAATFNLVINVFVSFLPHVDWGAHLGGALAPGPEDRAKP